MNKMNNVVEEVHVKVEHLLVRLHRNALVGAVDACRVLRLLGGDRGRGREMGVCVLY